MSTNSFLVDRINDFAAVRGAEIELLPQKKSQPFRSRLAGAIVFAVADVATNLEPWIVSPFPIFEIPPKGGIPIAYPSIKQPVAKKVTAESRKSGAVMGLRRLVRRATKTIAAIPASSQRSGNQTRRWIDIGDTFNQRSLWYESRLE